jgi:hypothetical protein
VAERALVETSPGADYLHQEGTLLDSTIRGALASACPLPRVNLPVAGAVAASHVTVMTTFPRDRFPSGNTHVDSSATTPVGVPPEGSVEWQAGPGQREGSSFIPTR